MSIADKLTTISENVAKVYAAGIGERPSGSVSIMQNGTYDVTDKAEAVVDVPTETLIVDGLLDGTLTSFYNDRITAVTGRNYIFGDYVNLQSIDMPNVTDVRGNAFRGCSALANANLPKLTLVDAAAFYACSALTELDLPCVRQIGTMAFVSSGLKKLVLRSKSVCSLGATNAFQGTPIASGAGYIYVPDDLVNSYKTATNWTSFANQIKSISELEE